MYSPDWVSATPNSTILSARVNAMVADFAADANAARPITAGGTGATSAGAARTALAVPGLAVANAFTAAQTWAEGAAIASAATLTLGTDGNFFHVTGTTAITAISGAASPVMLVFDGILALTHNATSLILPGAANITTAAGDTAIFVSEGSGNWRCVSYQPANGFGIRNSGWARLLNLTVSGSATSEITITNLAGYRSIRATGFLMPATDGAFLRFQASTNNGASWLSGAENDTQAHRASPTADTFDSASAAASITMSGLGLGIGNDTTSEGCTVNFNIQELGENRYLHLTSLNEYRTAAGVLISERVAGQVLNSSGKNALRLFWSSGNFAAGSWIEVEGLVQ